MEKVFINIHQRDLLLMPFPYSDLSASKVRPVLVISNDRFNGSSQNLIVCCVTSNISKNFYTILVEKSCLEEGELVDECCVKVENVAKIDKSKAIRKLGKINQKTFSEVREKFYSLFSNQ